MNTPYRDIINEPNQSTKTTKPFLCRLGWHKLELRVHRPYCHETMFMVACERENHLYVVGKSDFPDGFNFNMRPAKEIIAAFVVEYKKQTGTSPF